MPKYRYVGAGVASATLRFDTGELLDVLWCHGKVVELPANHDYTRGLLAIGLIEEVLEPKAPKTKARTGATKTKEEGEG